MKSFCYIKKGEIMATSSILHNFDFKDEESCERLVSALKQAEKNVIDKEYKNNVLKMIQSQIDINKESKILKTKDISDGYHTFGELYHHRAILFSIVCNLFKEKAWKSKLHADNTMFEGGMFIVGVTTEEGDYSYHYHLEYWDLFKVKEVENAPIWDGHQPSDITRLLSLSN